MIAARPHLEPGEGGRCWRRADRRIRAVEPRRHQELAAYHVISGQMRYLVDDRVCHAGPRTLLWVDNDHAHMLLSETPDFDMWIVVFGEELRPTANTRVDLVSRLAVAQHEELLTIASAAAATSHHETKLRGIAWWGERALAAALDGESREFGRCHPAVKRAAELVGANPAVTMAELGAQIGLSPDRIARLFRAETGERLNDYRNRSRLAAVDRLLAENRRANLLSCALDAGFGSYPQFFRIFRALRGTSPREWYASLEL